MKHIIKKSKKRFLITTAEERSWKVDRPVLFLGDWCLLYDRRSYWEKLDWEIVPYHWDDRSKLYRDYLYLCEVYEKLLLELSDALNQFHRVNHSKRYWRILVGPWLEYFTQMLFDRWTMIQQAASDFEIEGSVVLDFTPEETIPYDMNDFSAKFIDDVWNHFIYGQILINWTNVPCKKVVIGEARTRDLGKVIKEAPRGSLFKRFRSAVARKVFRNSFLVRKTDSFFISSYLPLWTDFQLQVLLGQVPQFWKRPQTPKTPYSLRERERLILLRSDGEDFEHCIRSLIPVQIPTIYVEGFWKLKEKVDSLPWPKQSTLIFTSNNHDWDDIFKAWAGTKVESGSKFLIGQHGGLYGTGLWTTGEDHEIKIADRYLTWGWSNESPKVCPAAALKLVGTSLGEWNSNGSLLLVTLASPRYSYATYSGRIASQLSDYFEDQFRFAGLLPVNLRSMLLVRLYGSDYGWSQIARWKDRYPDVELDSGTGPIQPLINKCRVLVATYNGTTFLETLGRNVPTVIFWNPDYSQIRESAKPYFEKLNQVGIFHESPESAAAKIAAVWDDVTSWWHQPEVQEARLYFCDRFARLPEKPIRVLREALTTV